MKTLTFKGYCPSCQLSINSVLMRYNVANELECPSCNLRIYEDGKKLALIHHNRGKNEFALKLTPTFNQGLYYTEADLLYDTYSNGSLLTNKEDLADYIAEIHPKTSRNLLHVLVDSYIAAFYQDKSLEYYYLISDLVGIDISQTMFNTEHKTSIYLFQYLHFVIECYDTNDFEGLENFPMNSSILDIYEQEISNYKEVLEQDIFLQKVALQNLIVTVIKNIYMPTEVTK